jgi:Asp-tRNA(Asn)/Glu-tRNA(Gln) amidotransferase A subunit family amidase
LPPSTIIEASRRIAAKDVSPVELTRAFLDRIDRFNVALHSFIVMTPVRALEDAQETGFHQRAPSRSSREISVDASQPITCQLEPAEGQRSDQP